MEGRVTAAWRGSVEGCLAIVSGFEKLDLSKLLYIDGGKNMPLCLECCQLGK